MEYRQYEKQKRRSVLIKHKPALSSIYLRYPLIPYYL